ncbi:ABC transporter permease subunit [Shinella zoogloeoides]|uniref:ABC transporter permease subunit n=1 Tax=Shinella zoogloeoides TaxID=352475 RepID=A0A6N8TH56_SHIZO|nr:ABC transporter permease subunit [Shinella zoogloeoides]MXO00514.1 ABC transporter permease subunit [Shinella zoogloeoides]UEX83893.1 ABC transporter permease subunit [Shinella zoogloeoides]
MTFSADIEALPQRIETEPAARAPTPLPVPVISAITVAAIIALWGLASAYALVSPVFLPSPRQVAIAAYNLAVKGFVDATLAEHVGASLYRIFGALIASVAIGIPAGIAIGTSRIGRGILDPIVEFLRPLPPLAYLPLVIIWAGIGEASKITVIALSMLPSIILSTSAGVRSVSKDHVNAARSLGASKRQVLTEVVLPSAVPSILTGIRIALGAGWTTLVAAELVAATSGIGFMIQSAAQFLVTDIVIAGIVVIALIAILLEYVARQIERRLVPWAFQR